METKVINSNSGSRSSSFSRTKEVLEIISMMFLVKSEKITNRIR